MPEAKTTVPLLVNSFAKRIFKVFFSVKWLNLMLNSNGTYKVGLRFLCIITKIYNSK